MGGAPRAVVKIFRGRRDEIPRLSGKWALTLGTFDGVHRGHHALLSETHRIGQRSDFAGAAAVTFERHPRTVLTPENAPPRLTTDSERAQLLAATGLDLLVILPFDRDTSQLGYDEFVRDFFIDRLALGHLVLGHDVHFGRGREGTVGTVAGLAESLGFGMSQVASVRYRDEPISSTRIRSTLAAGEVEEAGAMLGHPYLIRGVVREGRRVGRELGFPTANVESDHPRKILPADGVYGGWVRRPGREWVEAVINVGRAPTVSQDGDALRRVEAHLLVETDDFYGEEIEVAVARRLRGEQRFDGLEALKAAIEADVVAWRASGGQLPPELDPARLGPPWPEGGAEGAS